jgi:hypothetical protein
VDSSLKEAWIKQWLGSIRRTCMSCMGDKGRADGMDGFKLFTYLYTDIIKKCYIDLKSDLAEWTAACNIPLIIVDNLLRVLLAFFSYLPSDVGCGIEYKPTIHPPVARGN